MFMKAIILRTCETHASKKHPHYVLLLHSSEHLANAPRMLLYPISFVSAVFPPKQQTHLQHTRVLRNDVSKVIRHLGAQNPCHRPRSKKTRERRTFSSPQRKMLGARSRLLAAHRAKNSRRTEAAGVRAPLWTKVAR